MNVRRERGVEQVNVSQLRLVKSGENICWNVALAPGIAEERGSLVCCVIRCRDEGEVRLKVIAGLRVLERSDDAFELEDVEKAEAQKDCREDNVEEKVDEECALAFAAAAVHAE